MKEFQSLTAETDADASEADHIKALFAEVDTNKDGKVLFSQRVFLIFLAASRFQMDTPAMFQLTFSHPICRSALMSTWVRQMPQHLLQQKQSPPHKHDQPFSCRWNPKDAFERLLQY